MMKRTGCSRIVTMHHAHGQLIDAVRQEMFDIELDELPTLADAFPNLGREIESDPFVPYPPPASRPSLDRPAIYLHSSGTTGFPKPIAHSYKVQIHWMTQPGTYGYLTMSAPRRLGVMSLPPFHNYGLVFQLYVPIACLITAVVYPPCTAPAQPVIPTTDNILHCVRQTNCNILMTVPTFLEQWANSESAIEELKKLELVLYGGGPLPVKIGDALCAAGVPVGVEYGGTEFGCPVGVPHKQDIADGDWLWMRLTDDVKVRWVPQGDDTYECQILSTESNQVAVENIPDVKGYATSDVFIKHPTKDLWRIVGRTDDVITLASGEKAVPAPMESIITSSPILQGAVMFGRERNQVGILVEPRSDVGACVGSDMSRSEHRPFVEEANKTCPAFSRIFKEMMLITSSDKPMERAGKGTVQKKATLKAYESEIDTLYETVEASFRSSNGSSSPSTWDGHELETWLTEHALALSPAHHIDPNSDLFVRGFDSLSATYLRNQVLGTLRDSPDSNVRHAASRIPHNLVFNSPTIKLLVAQLSALINRDETAQTTELREQHIAAMNNMIDRFSIGLNETALDGRFDERGIAAVVLLSGSTGNLGSFVLAQLLKNPIVEKVYALNRPSSSLPMKDRQRSAFIDKGLPIELLDSVKLVYVEADASKEKCGISASLYNEIRDCITVIIHNAWRLDFNLPLASFEPNIQATRNLVDLGLDSKQRQKLRFVFTSSVGSANSWDLAQGPFPEEVQLDPSVAVGSGYGESKYVAERIVAKSGLHATSLRIGQIAGGPNGCWATTDWLPIIAKSSITLGALPEAHGVVSWMRAEDVAAAVLEIALTEDATPAALNIVNPRAVPWLAIMTSVRNSIIESSPVMSSELPFVPFQDWFFQLEKRAEAASADGLVDIPAIRLLEFFRAMAEGDRISRRSRPADTEAGGMTRFSTVKSSAVSSTISQMRPLGEVEASSWVRYWESRGLF
ncbi:putative nonribosomal peptide synthetase [Phlebopus sp. FC_14]|nr:putative nonribosomal peptide synthetase [Phlebopus sp. FC_14]